MGIGQGSMWGSVGAPLGGGVKGLRPQLVSRLCLKPQARGQTAMMREHAIVHAPFGMTKCFHTLVTLCPHLCAQGTAMWLPAASCAPTATAFLSLEWSMTLQPGEKGWAAAAGGWGGPGEGTGIEVGM